MSEDVIAGLERFATPVIADSLRAARHTNVVMTGLSDATRTRGTVAGRARTLRMVPWRADLDTAERAAGLRSFVESVTAREVLVIEGFAAANCACVGDLLMARAHHRGAKAAVVDGLIRDQVAIEEIGLPVWCRGSDPRSSVGELLPWESGGAIRCGGVTVRDGDYIAADPDAVVVVPAAIATEVLRVARDIEDSSERARTMIKAGRTLDEAYPRRSVRATVS